MVIISLLFVMHTTRWDQLPVVIDHALSVLLWPAKYALIKKKNPKY